MAQERLQKVMAAAGVASRRNCEELILEGVVRVNKRVVASLPVFVDPEKDVITVHGKRLTSAKKVYFLLNKPKGVICTNSDPQGRRKAIDIVESKERIFCVGRLDIDTSGLILLTNDSELTNRLTHPRYEISKTYVATINGEIEVGAIEKLKKGVWLSEGKTGRSSIKIMRRSHGVSTVEMMIRQGLNRQIRRSFARVGLKVKTLTRTKIGKIGIKGLGVGQWRTLQRKEVLYLQKAVGWAEERVAKAKKKD
jgi:pseudouridine synthase